MPEPQPVMPEAQPARSKAQPTRSEAQPTSQASGFRLGWVAQRGEQTYGQMYRKSPHSKDLVSYWGRCPASPHENQGESRAGKGTADHLMPLGYFFLLAFLLVSKHVNF